MGIVLAILLFGFLIFFHEFGHFLMAKAHGILVEEFSIGMGPCLFSRQGKETKYALRLLPIGGYCVMGEDEDAPNSFNSHSVWQRISVIAAGPLFNFLLAFLFSVILILMAGVDRPVISEVSEGYPAEEAGITAGDTIVRMGNKRIHIFREISFYNQLHQGETIDITYQHDGETRIVTVSPKYDEETNYYYYGLSGGGYTKATAFETLQYGVYEVEYWINTTLKSLEMLLTGQVGLTDLSGPVGIVEVVDESYQYGKNYGVFGVIVQMLYIAILISANLGVINLVPIPGLDGGKLLFLVLEAIRGKRISPEREGFVEFLGMAFLLLFIVVISFNDIRQIFF